MKPAKDILTAFCPYDDLDFINSVAAVNAMKEYAKQAIEEQLKIAAKEAETKSFEDYIEGAYVDIYVVNQESILNCKRVELK
jgi:hypothetical protein